MVTSGVKRLNPGGVQDRAFSAVFAEKESRLSLRVIDGPDK